MAEPLSVVTYSKVSGSPVFAAKLKDSFCIVDNMYNFYTIHPDSYRVDSVICFAKEAKPLHRHSKILCASKNKDVCISLEKSSKLNILVANGDKFSKKTTLTWHDSEVECSAYSPDGSFFASGGADGRVIIYDTAKYEIQHLLDRRSDYISQISFSDDSTLVCASSFDKVTMVYDTDRAKMHCAFELDDIVERSFFFNSMTRLYFVTRYGSSGIYDLLEKKQISLLHHFASWPVSVKKTDDNLFAIVGTKSDRLYVIDLRDNSVAISVKLENPTGIASLEIHNGRLAIGFTDGNIEIVDFNSGIDEIDVYLKTKNYEKALRMLNANCFLAIYPGLLERIEEGWKETLPKAIALISKGLIEESYKIAKPFLEDEKRAAEYEFYVSQRGEVAEFMDAVEKKNLPKAYSIAQQSPFITKMSVFKNLEDYWYKCFGYAKKILSEDSSLNRPKAQETLKPFAMVEEKKNLIVNLLNNADKFKNAEAAIKAKEFTTYFALCDKYPFLKDTEVYKKTLLLAESLIERAVKLEADNKLDDALSVIATLKTFTPYERAAFERAEAIKSKKLFLEAFEARKDSMYLSKAYELAVKHVFLQTTKEFKVMYEEFRRVFASIEHKVHSLKPYQVLSEFGSYTRVNYWAGKVGQLMRVAYLDEIKYNCTDKNANIKKAIDEFVRMFGKDVELEKLCKGIGLGEFYDSLKDVRMPTTEYSPTLF